jgi:serine/threonine-protein kinase
MDNARWQRLLDLFAQARATKGDDREQLLREVTRDDPDLTAELRSLLLADQEPGFMDEMGARLTPVSKMLAASVPDRVGPWRIISELGRGGMGVVHLAERADGHFEQRVAIKLIETSNAGDPLHRRFLAERQILAGLAHPNIARLLDGGIADDGRPWLAMEFVDGLPITEWCDRHGLDLRARLRLFADVCAAVQHAHQKLVIHRDIKPSNILVSADGRVHLLDFGIAQLVAPSLHAEAAIGPDVRAMTPEYASPEQVRGDALTTATDIYSLGALLYVLLTGRLPYRVSRGSLSEMTNAICDEEVERPAARAAQGDVDAASRGTTAERLARELRGDLDGIVLLAMRKEPGGRYVSADALREDIERHLAGQPVMAHHGGHRYRLSKFVRRHRVEVGALALMMGGLLAGLTIAVGQGRRASRERDRAELARAQSQGVSEFMLELFRTGDVEDTLTASGLTALDLLRRGAARANALSDQPAVQARLLDVVGQMSLNLGQLDDAQRLLEQAVAIRRQHRDDVPGDLTNSLIHLGWVHRARGDNERARAIVSEALALRQDALPPDHPDIAEALYELGWLTGGPPQEALYRQALDILPDTGAPAERRVTLLQALATNYRRQGRLSEAVTTSREGLRVAESALGADHYVTGDAMVHHADHVRDVVLDLTTAEQLYRRGLELIERRFGDNSIRLIHGLHSLGTLLSSRSDTAAEQVFRRAIAIRRLATGPEHPQVAEGLQFLAGELVRQGRLAEAEALQRQALAHSMRTLGARHPVVTGSRLPRLALILARQGRQSEADATFESALAQAVSSLAVQGEVRRDYGLLLLGRGEFQRAEQQLLRALALLEQHYSGQDHPNVQESKRALMALYGQWGKAELVERYRVPPGRYVAY